MARKKDTTAVPAPGPNVVLIPAASSFDFLEGAFARSERSRLIGIAVVGAAAVALAATIAAGALGTVEASSQQELLAQTQTQMATLNAELSTLDSADGIPTSQITSHIAGRTAALKSAVGEEIDSAALVADLRASAPPGVELTGVTVTAGSSAEASSPSGLGTVTATAQASSYALIAQWSQALMATPSLSEVDVSWSGGGSNVALSLTASLTDQALSERAAQAGGGPMAAAPATNQTNGES